MSESEQLFEPINWEENWEEDTGCKDSKYKSYFLTRQPGDWFECQTMCEEMDGSLIYDSLKLEQDLKRFVFSY